MAYLESIGCFIMFFKNNCAKDVQTQFRRFQYP